MKQNEKKFAYWNIAISLLGVLVSLSTLIVLINTQNSNEKYYAGGYNEPSIVRITNPVSGDICPQSLSYMYYEGSFNLVFKNGGNKNTNLNVSVYSDDINITPSSHRWYLETGTPQSYDFSLSISKDKIRNLNNISIFFNYTYDDGKYASKSELCFYSRNGGPSDALSSFQLVK